MTWSRELLNIIRRRTRIPSRQNTGVYLVLYEPFKYVNDAIAREKEIKGWRKEKKLDLIRSFNPQFRFLNGELFGEWPPKEQSARN